MVFVLVYFYLIKNQFDNKCRLYVEYNCTIFIYYNFTQMPRSKISTSDMIVNYFRLIWTWAFFLTFFKTAFAYNIELIFWRWVSNLGSGFDQFLKWSFFCSWNFYNFHVKCLFKHNFYFQIPFFNISFKDTALEVLPCIHEI